MSALYVCDACGAQSPAFGTGWIEMLVKSQGFAGSMVHACCTEHFHAVLVSVIKGVELTLEKQKAAADQVQAPTPLVEPDELDTNEDDGATKDEEKH